MDIQARTPAVSTAPSNDTSPAAARVQLELLRKASTSRRSALTFEMSHQALALSQRAIRRAHPTWSEDEIERSFLEIHYGRDIAVRVKGPL